MIGHGRVAPAQDEAPDGFEYLATLLVISTPDGFRSRWDDEEPSAAVRFRGLGVRTADEQRGPQQRAALRTCRISSTSTSNECLATR